MKTISNIRHLLMPITAAILLAACNQPPTPQSPEVANPAQVSADSNTTAPQDNMQPTMDTATTGHTTGERLMNDINKAIEDSQKPLKLVITNLASKTAPVILSLYNMQNKFLDEKDVLKHLELVPNGETLVAEIKDLQYGQFAIATYQDVNSDGKINQNLIGLPTEPYAFSNNYKPVIRAPRFSDCKFDYDAVSNTVTIAMIR